MISSSDENDKLIVRQCSVFRLPYSFATVFMAFFIVLTNGSQNLEEKLRGRDISPSSFFNEDFEDMRWDNLDLEFLSNVRGSTLHEANEFHVINASFASDKTSYIIHLSKPDELFHPSHLNITGREAEEMRCIFSGTISEMSRSNANENIKHGVVSLASCNHETGFEGLILLPHEQYYIMPQGNKAPFHIPRMFRRSTKELVGNQMVPHKAFKIKDGSPFVKTGRHFDVVKHPPPELLKEARRNAVNLDHLEDEDDLPSADSLDSEHESSDNEETGVSCIGQDCDSHVSPLIASLTKGLKTKGSNLNKNGRNRKKGNQQMYQTNGSSGTKVVEIAVFTDEALYKIFKSRYPSNTKTKLNQYILAIINNMNALYKQPSMTDKVTFRLVHIEIEPTKPRSINTHNGAATKYLTSFCKYESEKNQMGSLWDHGLLLTGIDLIEDGSNGVAGIAWFSTMCVNGYSCSLIEAHNFNSAFITTHEIGHSLGMEHDGEGANLACDPNSYIMSPTTGGGKTDWSKCSVKNMKNFISSGYQSNPAPVCVLKKGQRAGNAIKFSSSKYPGQLFDGNTQCDAICKGCIPYTQPPYNDMCHMLYCRPATNSISFQILGMHPALEGTTCARGKICRLGKCV